jgi:hypothetical protein
VQFDTIAYSFSKRVTPSGLDGIAGLISSLPDIYPYRPTRGQMPSCKEQYGTPSTSQVQDSLIAPELQLVD